MQMEHPLKSDVRTTKQYWGDSGNTDAAREFEEEGRQVAQEDFENTMSELAEMFFEDECASCMEDILADYLIAKGYLIIYPWMQGVSDYVVLKEEAQRRQNERHKKSTT